MTTRARAGRSSARPALTWVAVAFAVGAAAFFGFGYLLAGSPAHLAAGVKINGVDVGGLTPGQARRLLERRFEDVQRTPIRFAAGGRKFDVMAVQLGIEPDFADAVKAAQDEGDGFGPFRGYRRLRVRLSANDVQPRVAVWDVAVRYHVAKIAKAVDRRPHEPALVRRGLRIVPVRGRIGELVDRTAAARLMVSALAGFDRSPVTLPVETTQPKLEVADLQSALRRSRTAVSAPVRLVVGARAYRVPRWRIATMLDLPANGRTTVAIGGKGANAYFAKLARAVDRPPTDATFAVDGPNVSVVPSRPGFGLDVPESARAVLAAVTRSRPREAHLAMTTTHPKLTTADAKAMGIVTRVSSYETEYGGDDNRRHNVQLVAHLVDKHLIPPGQEFSFNKTTGERTAAKGFLEAPVIINGELQTGLGGGVCQVSTTVFNAAFDAGLSITERTNHALYISHYPLGRDATVDYPSTDLKFMNDTGHWLLLRTFVGESSLVVNLYGVPTHRRVEVETAPLRVIGPPPVERVADPELTRGTEVVDDYGVPAQATSVHRRVFSPSGKLMYDTTWSSSYRAEPKVVRFGTKSEPKATTTTTTTAPTTTTTAPTTTTTTATTSTTPPPRSTPPATTAPASAGT